MTNARHALRALALSGLAVLGATSAAVAQAVAPPGEEPALTTTRFRMQDLPGMSLQEMRAEGLRIFATPFNTHDGFGDGPMDPFDPVSPGGRPTLGGNGAYLRVNGLDAQSCFECHSVLSQAAIPPTMAVGGTGLSSANVINSSSSIDVADTQGAGAASFTGRFINPPFVFGAGGVELLAKEMTADLQRLRQVALDNPGTVVRLLTKGVDFGRIAVVDGELNTSRVEGIDEDLVVRPFGRKGEFATTRAFDVAAMEFHFGIQPVEVVGTGIDDDGDGVVDELLAGELSLLEIFNTTLKPPFQEPRGPEATRGAVLFGSLGCAACHVPTLTTDSPTLTYSFPEVETDPSANVFYDVDLRRPPTSFPVAAGGGIQVQLFSDLKRHDMGPGLAEAIEGELASQFVTPRLWGIADSGPYLHDGRAQTLTQAIELHGGEGQAARDAFASRPAADRMALLAFLRTLRTPTGATEGL